jgi:hypothetical protein
MHTTRPRAVLGTVMAAGMMLALGAAPVAAAGPEIVRQPVDDPRFFPAGTRGAFDVQGARTGTLTTRTWTDESGAITRQTFTWSDGKIVYTNPANGKTVRTILAGPFIFEPLGDGTAIVTIPGNNQAVVAPGFGFIQGQTGLSKTIVDVVTFEVLEVLREAGHQELPFPDGCIALA